MTEMLLNLCWLAVAALALSRWALHGRSGRVPALSSFLSLVCVLALLFPVISASDDLLQQEFTDDAGRTQAVIKNAGTGEKVWQHHHSPAVVASAAAALLRAPAREHLLADPGQSFAAPAPVRSLAGRSPPSFL
jgi:hypothetical protein